PGSARRTKNRNVIGAVTVKIVRERKVAGNAEMFDRDVLRRWLQNIPTAVRWPEESDVRRGFTVESRGHGNIAGRAEPHKRRGRIGTVQDVPRSVLRPKNRDVRAAVSVKIRGR